MISKIRKKLLKERKDYILSELDYEGSVGNLHKCGCSKNCRNIKCTACWKLDLDKINKELKNK